MNEIAWARHELPRGFSQHYPFADTAIVPHIFTLLLIDPVNRNGTFDLFDFSLCIISEITVRMEGSSRRRIARTAETG